MINLRKINSFWESIEDIDLICDVGEHGRSIIESTSFKSQTSYNFRRGRRMANIINDMFTTENFKGKRILELGPGHYAFALLAKSLGAEVFCIENDPSFAKLGRHLGFEVIEKNFFDLEEIELDRNFDGLFVKGTFNACNVKQPEYIDRFVEKYTSLIKSDGWGWFVTANKSSTNASNIGNDNYVNERIELQREAFEKNGWDARTIHADFDRPRYAMNYSGSRYLFTRNLDINF